MAYHRYDSVNSKHKKEEFHEIFAEFDFGYIDSGCNFFCPECRDILKCEAYKEIGESWESFYM